MITKLSYGLREGKLISIEDVEKGLECKCICPACKGMLVAIKVRITCQLVCYPYKTCGYKQVSTNKEKNKTIWMSL